MNDPSGKTCSDIKVLFFIPFERKTTIDFWEIIENIETKLHCHNICVHTFCWDELQQLEHNTKVYLIAHGNDLGQMFFSSSSGPTAESKFKKNVYAELNRREIVVVRDFSCSTSISDRGMLLNLSVNYELIVQVILRDCKGVHEPNTKVFWDIKNEIERPNHRS